MKKNDPTQKAEELIVEFFSVHTVLHCKNGCITIDSIGMDSAKRGALIAVDEILNTLMKIKFYSELNFLQERRYWQEVKQEIERYTKGIGPRERALRTIEYLKYDYGDKAKEEAIKLTNENLSEFKEENDAYRIIFCQEVIKELEKM
jgi:hypothetical protein